MEDKTQKKLKTISKKSNRTWKWNDEEDGIIWGHTNDFIGGEKVAMFDMDGNLIVTKSGTTFARNSSDWKWFDSCVPTKIKEYVSNDFVIVIATNQLGIGKGKVSPLEIKTKIQTFSKEWNCPVAVMMACGENIYRKPSTGMWDFFKDNMNDGVEINLHESFYVGDAAGRPKGNGRKKKDHSHGDRCFAINVGIKFYTPEMFFLNQKESLPTVPKTIYQIFGASKSIFQGDEYVIDSSNKHVVFFIGPPGSGKSTLWNNKFQDWTRVNNDSQKSKKKSKDIFMSGIQKGTGILIDNTNRDQKQRSDWIKLARQYKYKTIALRFAISKEESMMLNKLRRINPYRTHISKKVPDMVIHSFFKYVEEPEQPEFDEVYTVRPVLEFENEQEEQFLKKIL